MGDGNIRMMNKKEKAVEYFKDNLHCSQSVLAAFAKECGITEEQAFRLCFKDDNEPVTAS